MDTCVIVKSSFIPQHAIRIILTLPAFRNGNCLNLDEKTSKEVAKLNLDSIDTLHKYKWL